MNVSRRRRCPTAWSFACAVALALIVVFGDVALVTPEARALAAPAAEVVERTWVGVSGGPQPPGNGAMAYDLARHQTVLLVPGHPSETWVFDGAMRRWSQRFPVISPALAGAAAAFDAARGYVVLFGSNADASTCNPAVPGETWTWNGTTWTHLHPANAPDECAGLSATVVYDAARQRDLLVCGCSFVGTWLWDGVNWTNAGGAPHGSTLAYDPTSQRVVSFGGYLFFHGDNDFGDTSAWNGSRWIELSPGGGPRDPEPRAFASMTFDPVVGALVLFGGMAHYPAPHAFSDTWRWVGTHWVRMGTAASPPAMARASFVNDPDHHLGVLFGGPKQTWLLTAAHAGGGFFVAERDGTVAVLGDAAGVGDAHTLRLNQPIVGLARTVTRKGYWLAAADGGIFSYGDARFFGSTGNIRLNQPIVGIAPAPSGRGYWLVARDGGIFAFGDARFAGSTGSLRLNQPIVGMAPTPTGDGYWLVAGDGGIFAFGDARFFGSAGNIPLNQPVTGMAATPRGDGYWLVARDGGIFTYGHARFAGAASSARPVIAVTPSPTGAGYSTFDDHGAVGTFGDAESHGRVSASRLRAPVVGAAAT
jgi:hypothetical protein